MTKPKVPPASSKLKASLKPGTKKKKKMPAPNKPAAPVRKTGPTFSMSSLAQQQKKDDSPTPAAPTPAQADPQPQPQRPVQQPGEVPGGGEGGPAVTPDSGVAHQQPPTAPTRPASPVHLAAADAEGGPLPVVSCVLDVEPPAPQHHASIAAMMHVAGDTAHPHPLTVHFVERVLRDQLLMLYLLAVDGMRQRRGKLLNLEDLLVPVRRNKGLMARLTGYLNVVNVRPLWDDSHHPHGPPGDVVLDGEDELVPLHLPTGPTDMGPYRRRLCGWDIVRAHADVLPDMAIDTLRPHDPDRAQRMQRAEQRTRDMGLEAYMHYSECSHMDLAAAIDPFVQWITPATIRDYVQPSTQVAAVFRFLAWETVRALTERALELKGSRQRRGLEGKQEAPRSHSLFQPQQAPAAGGLGALTVADVRLAVELHGTRPRSLLPALGPRMPQPPTSLLLLGPP